MSQCIKERIDQEKSDARMQDVNQMNWSEHEMPVWFQPFRFFITAEK